MLKTQTRVERSLPHDGAVLPHEEEQRRVCEE